MTVSSNPAITGPLPCNGVVVQFSYLFSTPDDDGESLRVTHRSPTGSTVLAWTTGTPGPGEFALVYRDQNGGTIEVGEVYPVGDDITIRLDLAFEQMVAFSETTRYAGDTHEDVHDRQVMMVKQLEVESGLAVRTEEVDLDPTLPPYQPDTNIGYHPTEKRLVTRVTLPSEVTLPLQINQGGTGETNAQDALTALGGVGLDAANTFTEPQTIARTGDAPLILKTASDEARVRMQSDAHPASRHELDVSWGLGGELRLYVRDDGGVIQSQPLMVGAQDQLRVGNPAAGEGAFSLNAQGGLYDNGIRVPAVRNFLYGLGTSRLDANTVEVASGQCVSRDGTTLLVHSAAMSKRIDQAFVPGSGNGGMADPSSVPLPASPAWYHLFIIANASTGAVDFCWDVDENCSNIPAGWHKPRRIWSHRWETTALREYIQACDYCVWSTPPTDYNGASGTGLVNRTITVPDLAEGVVADLYGYITTSADEYVGGVFISTPGITDRAATVFGGNDAQMWLSGSGGSPQSMAFFTRALALGAQVAVKSERNDTLVMVTKMYEDRRRPE